MSTDDPFAPEADPDRDDSFVTRPLGRRRFGLVLLASIPAVASNAGCVALRLACARRPGAAQACRHRFCRYYDGE